MPTIIDREGQVFGKLRAVQYTGRAGKNKTAWLCECECGKMTIVRTDKLVSGNTKSCGRCNSAGMLAGTEALPRTGLARATLDGFNNGVMNISTKGVEDLPSRIRVTDPMGRSVVYAAITDAKEGA